MKLFKIQFSSLLLCAVLNLIYWLLATIR